MKTAVPWILLSMIAFFFATCVKNVDEYRFGRAGHEFKHAAYSGRIEFSTGGISGVIYHPSTTTIAADMLSMEVTDEYKHAIEGRIKIYYTTPMPDQSDFSYTSFVFEPKITSKNKMWPHTGLYNFTLYLEPDRIKLVSASSYWEKFSSYKICSPIFLGWK